jgi:hypothetical protein
MMTRRVILELAVLAAVVVVAAMAVVEEKVEVVSVMVESCW